MIEKIISGGQTGADHTGLVVAKLFVIPTGGTAPKGWRICNYDGSDGSNPGLADFGLVEHESPQYPPRTEQNVINSDGTVLFGHVGSPGAKLTIRCCETHQRHIATNPTPERLVKWSKAHHIKTLNVAGNRHSRWNPNIIHDTFLPLAQAFWLMGHEFGYKSVLPESCEIHPQVEDAANEFMHWSADIERITRFLNGERE